MGSAMINKGELNGTRFLSRKTVELMTVNHLTPDLMPIELGGVYMPGFGFGLGFQVVMDVGQCLRIDTQEELIVILMAQFQPFSFHLVSEDFQVME